VATNKQRGGSRQNSGRKPSGVERKAVTIRLPVDMIDEIKDRGKIQQVIENALRLWLSVTG
jgi:uncharacterized protein (DUF4415 family)